MIQIPTNTKDKTEKYRLTVSDEEDLKSKYFKLWFKILFVMCDFDFKACAFCWFWFCLQITVWWILWLVLCSEIHHYKKEKFLFSYHAACTACMLHALHATVHATWFEIEQHIWKSKTITWVANDRTSFWCPSLLNVCMQHGLATRMLSVRSSDNPSVRHVICDKMKETCAHILILHDRTFILVLERRKMVDGASPSTCNFWSKWPQ